MHQLVQRTLFSKLSKVEHLLFVCLFVLGHTIVAHAEGSYEYHPSSPLTLGGGFDPKAPLKVYVTRCLQYTKTENIDTTGAYKVDISGTIIKDQTQFFAATGVSASLDAHYSFYSGGGSFNQDTSFVSSSDSLTWIIKAEVIFGRYRPVDASLSPTAEVMKTEPTKFTTRCGSEFVAQETRGGRALAIFTARNLSSETKDSLESSLHAAFSSPGAGGSASASYKQALSNARKSAFIDLRLVTFGGPGPSQLKAALLDIENLPEIRKTLANYVTQMTSENAIPVRSETASFSQFGLVEPGSVFANRDNVLTQLNLEYRDTWGIVQRVYSYTRPVPTGPRYSHFVEENKRKELEELSKKYENKSSEIFAQAKKCLAKDDDCTLVDVATLPQILFPPIPEVPEVFLLERCTSSLLRVIGSPAANDGEIVGYLSGIFALVGPKELIERVTVDYAQTQNLIPISSSNPLLELLPVELPDRCSSFDFDMKKGSAFGRFKLDLRQGAGNPTIVISDTLGRVRRFDVPIN
jgi:hypothetical protein